MCLVLLTDDVHAELDALITDEDGGASNELADLVLGLATERAIEGVLRIWRLAHAYSCPGLTGSQGTTLPPWDGAGQEPRFAGYDPPPDCNLLAGKSVAYRSASAVGLVRRGAIFDDLVD